MEQSIIEYMKEQLDMGETDVKTYSALALAYLGDCVFELIVRTSIVSKGNAPVHKYHMRASSIVNAHAQAVMIKALEPELTEEELNVYKRGRNSKPATMAKNASAKEYKTATGFEAVVGYLFLTNQYTRLIDLVKKGLKAWEEKQEEFASSQGENH